MPMKIKIDEKTGGAVVTDQGHVIFVDSNGADLPVDVPALYSKVEELNAESAKHRKQRNELRDKYKIFDGIENVVEYKTNAEKALGIVKNLKDKELVDAGKVEQIKLETIAAKDTEITEIKNQYAVILTEKDTALNAATVQIRDLLIGAQFRQSNYFVGTDTQPRKTTLPPDVAETFFGRHFKVEAGKDGKPAVVGYDAKGNQIYSRKKPGELADFDEAITRIVEEYPRRDEIMRVGKGGSGDAGGLDAGRRKNAIEQRIATLETAYAKAMTEKRGRDAVVIKNQLFDLKNKQLAGATAP